MGDIVMVVVSDGDAGDCKSGDNAAAAVEHASC